MTTYTATAQLQGPTIATLQAQAGALALQLAGDTHAVVEVELSGIEAMYSAPSSAPMSWRATATIVLESRPAEPEPDAEPGDTPDTP
jgi:predicted secreted protein